MNKRLIKSIFFDRLKSELLSENDAEKKISRMSVRILNSNNNSVAEIKVNNKMIKEEYVAIKTNEKTMKEN